MAGFWLNVDGDYVHVTGDPQMSEKSAGALAEIVRIVRAMTPEQVDKLAARSRLRVVGSDKSGES